MSKEKLMKQLKDLQNTKYYTCLIPGAEIIVQEARDTVHVITGNLRDSIEVKVEGKTVNIVAGADYAGEEEYREGNHAYLRPAIDNKAKEAHKAIGKAVDKKIEEVVT